jgi:hypothetical protein
MFKRKEKIGFQFFMRQIYLPSIEKMVDDELDSLYTEISKNTPPIIISKEQTKFELFLAVAKASGYGLGQIKSLDERFYGQQSRILEEYLRANFGHVELNPIMLYGKENHVNLSDYWLYMRNKSEHYREYEKLVHEDKILREHFKLAISGVFFAGVISDWRTINEPLAMYIGDLYNGFVFAFYQTFSAFGKECEIIPDA